jgi:hypothetical protein
MAKLNLFGPRLKVARARRHLADLEHLIEAFFSDNPYDIRMERCPSTGGLRVVAQFSRPLPNDTATIIGDVVHNLRCALDLLASDALRSNSAEPTRYTGFPIYETEAAFTGGRASKLAGAPDVFVDFVCGLRPFKSASDGSEGDLLIWSLGQLDNDDKHITLLPTIGVASVKNAMAVHEDGPEHGFMMLGEVRISGQGYAPGVSLGGPGMNLIAGGQASFSVALNHRNFFSDKDVRTALREIEARVTEVISRAGDLAV